MGIFGRERPPKTVEEVTKPTEGTIAKAVEDGGKATEEFKIKQQEEVEARMTKWTSGQMDALIWLKDNLPGYREKFQNMTPDKVDFVERFEKNPSEVIPSVIKDKKTGEYKQRKLYGKTV